MSDWSHGLKDKIRSGVEWRGDVNVPVGDDTWTLTVRMLSESERHEILPMLNMEALAERQAEIEEVDNPREADPEDHPEPVVQALQSAEELSEEEEARLDRAQEVLTVERASMFSDLGEETFEALRKAGKYGLVADEEDVNNAMDCMVAEQRERFGPIPDVPPVENITTRGDFKDAVEAEMVYWLEQSPYDVLSTVGMRVLNATQGEGKSNDE